MAVLTVRVEVVRADAQGLRMMDRCCVGSLGHPQERLQNHELLRCVPSLLGDLPQDRRPRVLIEFHMPARLEGYFERLVSMQEEPPTLSGFPNDEGAHREVVLTRPSVNVCHDDTAAYPQRVLPEARATCRCYVHGVRVSVAPTGHLHDYVFTVIAVFDSDGGLVLCRHKDRSTWETPGGHIEPGETPAEAATRELFEETGIVPKDLTAVADYEVDGVAGRLFSATIGTRSPLPDFEIAETTTSDTLPDDLTYPAITPILVSAATEWRSQHRHRGAE